MDTQKLMYRIPIIVTNLLILSTKLISQNTFDLYKTSTQDKLNPSQIVIQLNEVKNLSISEMICEINDFLGKDTRTLSCGINSNSNSYSGTLKVFFIDGSAQTKQVFIEQPINNGVMNPWGSAAMAVYGYTEINYVQFSANGTNIIWQETNAARSTLAGTYNYGKAMQYPPVVNIDEMMCHISTILVGKDQNTANPPAYIITCGIAGSQPEYSGRIAVWWHQYESRIPEVGDTPNISKQISTNNTANHSQHVSIFHDKAENSFAYWGITSFIIQIGTPLAFDRFNFYLDSEGSTWTTETVPINGTSRSNNNWYCKLYRKVFHKKAYYLR